MDNIANVQPLLMQVAAWQWFFIIGLVLMLFELLITEFFLLWIGFACALTAVVVFVGNFAILGQVASFVVFSIITLTIGYVRYERKSTRTITQKLNNRKEELIGYVLHLDEAITPEKGDAGKTWVSINDTRWLVSSDQPIDAGQRVHVRRIDGNTLIVDRVV